MPEQPSGTLSTLSAALSALLPCYPPGVRELLEAELPVLKLQALRLALEAAQSEATGISYVDAAGRLLEYPLMARVHHGLLAMLQHEVPEEVLEAICRFLARAAADEFADIRDAVVVAARGEDMEGALLRFLLYQAARLELWLRTWREPAFEATGTLAQLDREAADRLKLWLTLAPNLPSGVRPLHVATAELVFRVTEIANEKETRLRSLAAEAMNAFQRLLDAATAARELPVEDAIVLRNEYQDLLGGHRLASAELVDLHPDQFPSIAAVDQRRHRLRQALSRDDHPIRHGAPRMVDVALAMMDAIETEQTR